MKADGLTTSSVAGMAMIRVVAGDVVGLRKGAVRRTAGLRAAVRPAVGAARIPISRGMRRDISPAGAVGRAMAAAAGGVNAGAGRLGGDPRFF